jgi:hypothetical protein
VLTVAHTARKRGQPLNRTQQWALALAERKGHNTAAVALANKTARRLWAAEHHGTRFDHEHVSRRDTHATAPALPGLKPRVSRMKNQSQKPWSDCFATSCRQGLTGEPMCELLGVWLSPPKCAAS